MNNSIPDDNPKTKFGIQKPSMSVVPPVALLHLIAAFENGAGKYGPLNWRTQKVSSTVYYNAAMRHLLDWFDGEDFATDSLVHHLGHVMACCAIVLDAHAQGTLNDDRPTPGHFSSEMERIMENKAVKPSNDTLSQIPQNEIDAAKVKSYTIAPQYTSSKDHLHKEEFEDALKKSGITQEQLTYLRSIGERLTVFSDRLHKLCKTEGYKAINILYGELNIMQAEIANKIAQTPALNNAAFLNNLHYYKCRLVDKIRECEAAMNSLTK